MPDAFDADSEQDREWLQTHIHKTVSQDLLFAVVFGKLRSQDIRVYCQHGGMVGLKLAVLQLINRSGLSHNPSFERELGAKGSPVREVLAMLTGAGLIVSPNGSMTRVATLKGRFLLDLARRLMLDWSAASRWSEELRLIMAHLGLAEPEMIEVIDARAALADPVWDILYSIIGSKQQFGIDLMEGIDQTSPELFSNLDWRHFSSTAFNPTRAKNLAWRDEDDLADPQDDLPM